MINTSTHLQFKSIEYKNILSVGNMPVKILFDKSPTTAIIGQNGQGKSTMLESLCFGLYNKPLRKISKTLLINDKNDKGLLVTVEFDKGSDKIKVIRGQKPGVFEIWVNDKMIDQSSKNTDYQLYLETEIIGMDFATFTQMVVIGKSNYTPFMELNATAKRSFIEEILGLTVFSDMLIHHKKNITDNTSALNGAKSDVRVNGEKVKSQKVLVEKIKEQNEEAKKDKISSFNSLIEKEEAAKAEIVVRLNRINELLENVNSDELDNEVQHWTERQARVNQLILKIRMNQDRSEKTVDFMKNHEVCPTCSQSLEHTFREDTITDESSKCDNFRDSITHLQKHYDESVEKLASLSKKLAAVSKLSSEKSSLENKIIHHERTISHFMTQRDTPSVTDESITEENLKLDDYRENLQAAMDLYNELNDVTKYNEVISTLLKDTGIKQFIVDKYMPTINKLINSNLKQLGLVASFKLDNQFKEEIKFNGFRPRIYHQMSEGEKLRFNMAVMMTWRQIAEIKSNRSTNLLILDEIFDASMDQSGVDAFGELISSMPSLNLFVITHTPEKIADRFRSFIKFERVDGFTKMVNAESIE